jgi:hypothetical protein
VGAAVLRFLVAALQAAVSDAPSSLTAQAFGQHAVAAGSAGTDAEPLLLPLPTNEEQQRILAQAQHSTGGTVQGPPGTGKSHTIANILSHYVAYGKCASALTGIRCRCQSKRIAANSSTLRSIPPHLNRTNTRYANDPPGQRRSPVTRRVVSHTTTDGAKSDLPPPHCLPLGPVQRRRNLPADRYDHPDQAQAGRPRPDQRVPQSRLMTARNTTSAPMCRFWHGTRTSAPGPGQLCRRRRLLSGTLARCQGWRGRHLGFYFYDQFEP